MTCATNTTERVRAESSELKPSTLARRRMLTRRGEPLFLADWMRVLMLHFEVDASALQRSVPYEPDLHNGRAFVTLVAFTMENMHPRHGGKLGALLFSPIATHDFLNVRTYVRHHGEPGIHFLAEWLSNWLAVQLGPRTFGLPYRHGRICYEHDCANSFCADELRMFGQKLVFRIVPIGRSPLPIGRSTPGRRPALHSHLANRAHGRSG